MPLSEDSKELFERLERIEKNIESVLPTAVERQSYEVFHGVRRKLIAYILIFLSPFLLVVGFFGFKGIVIINSIDELEKQMSDAQNSLKILHYDLQDKRKQSFDLMDNMTKEFVETHKERINQMKDLSFEWNAATPTTAPPKESSSSKTKFGWAFFGTYRDNKWNKKLFKINKPAADSESSIPRINYIVEATTDVNIRELPAQSAEPGKDTGPWHYHKSVGIAERGKEFKVMAVDIVGSIYYWIQVKPEQ